MVLHVSIWGGLQLCLGGLSLPKPPRGDGTACASRVACLRPWALVALPGRCLHSTVTCGKTPTTGTWMKILRFVATVFLRNKGQQQNNFANLPLQANKLHEWTTSLSLYDTRTVNLTFLLCSVTTILANKLLLQELNQLIGIKLLTSGFPEISWQHLFGHKAFSTSCQDITAVTHTKRLFWNCLCVIR